VIKFKPCVGYKCIILIKITFSRKQWILACTQGTSIIEKQESKFRQKKRHKLFTTVSNAFNKTSTKIKNPIEIWIKINKPNKQNMIKTTTINLRFFNHVFIKTKKRTIPLKWWMTKEMNWRRNRCKKRFWQMGLCPNKHSTVRINKRYNLLLFFSLICVFYLLGFVSVTLWAKEYTSCL
jgi:hypothetical protein